MRIKRILGSSYGAGRGTVLAMSLIAVSVSACSPGSGTPTAAAPAGSSVVTWEIAPELVPCVGVAPQQCMRVREVPDGDWQLFYDTIAGFEYEPGFEYVVDVAVAPVANAPADASSLSYTLVRVVEKNPVG